MWEGGHIRFVVEDTSVGDIRDCGKSLENQSYGGLQGVVCIAGTKKFSVIDLLTVVKFFKFRYLLLLTPRILLYKRQMTINFLLHTYGFLGTESS